YWAWDPVENVALLPWLVTTAFLHSVVIQERRGMLKVWNLSLVVGAFALTTFGTFLTRGSILESVHTFARTAVGPMYLAFLVLVRPLRSWRRRSPEQAARRLALPAVAGAGVIVGLAAAGVRDLAAIAAFGLAAFVLFANAGALVRSVRTFARANGRATAGS